MPAIGASAGLVIYTDGCFEPKSRNGGWAFIAQLDGATVASGFGGIRQTTNNSAELLALLKALEWLVETAPGEPATIWSDSVYVVRGCTEFLAIWRTNGWRKIETNSRLRKRKIADVELWRAAAAHLSGNPPISIGWCKGHSGIVGNENADGLADQGRLSLSDARSTNLFKT